MISNGLLSWSLWHFGHYFELTMSMMSSDRTGSSKLEEFQFPWRPLPWAGLYFFLLPVLFWAEYVCSHTLTTSQQRACKSNWEKVTCDSRTLTAEKQIENYWFQVNYKLWNFCQNIQDHGDVTYMINCQTSREGIFSLDWYQDLRI